MKALRGPLSLFLAVLLLAAPVPDLLAGKPGSGGGGGGGTSVDPTTIYEYRPDLGGWLDKERNLIWGTYSITSCVGGSYGYADSVAFAANYAVVLANGAAMYNDYSQHAIATGDQYASTDPDRAQHYYNLAADYAAAADELLACSVAASQVEGSNQWRMPSKAEVTDAINKRYFSYGAGGLNAWDTSPLPGLQTQTNYLLYWTTTADKGSRYQWAFDPPTGKLQSVLKDRSYLYAVAVRNYTPPVP